jgi:hypothetical protein
MVAPSATGMLLLCRGPVRDTTAAKVQPRTASQANNCHLPYNGMKSLHDYTYYSKVGMDTTIKVSNIFIATKHNDFSSFSGVEIHPTEFSCCKRRMQDAYILLLFCILFKHFLCLSSSKLTQSQCYQCRVSCFR